jgi:RNA polymerase sigma factor (sigma-70 family)
MAPPSTTGTRPSDAWFATTHWSVVARAGLPDTTRARVALELLCQTYWRPLYAYIRRRGHSPEDAADLTQEFFRHLLARNAVAAADPARGRFRSFLLSSANHFLSDARDKARAQKRGGGQVVAMDLSEAEGRLALDLAEGPTPEHAFERQWALALLEQVYRRLEDEYRKQGKEALFDTLRPALAGSREAQPYAELGRQLGMTDGAVRIAVHRLRQRYREILRLAIADTVDGPAEVEEELRHLTRVLVAT